MTDPSTVVDRLHELYPLLGATVGGPVPAADGPDGPYRGADLVTDRALVRSLVEHHAAQRDVPADRHAASLLLQRLAHRIGGFAAGSLALTGHPLDVSAANVGVRLRKGSPATLHLVQARWSDGADPVEAAVATAAEGFLLPFAEILHDELHLGRPNVWGNIAAGMAKTLCTLGDALGPEPMMALGQDLLARRPGLAHGGSFRIVTAHGLTRLFYDRASCCHWHVVRDGKRCSWCSLSTQDERTARFEAQLAKAAGA